MANANLNTMDLAGVSQAIDEVKAARTFKPNNAFVLSAHLQVAHIGFKLATQQENKDIAASYLRDRLDPTAKSEFERAAFDQADPLKRRWHDEARANGRDTADSFRLAILNDHFRRKCCADSHT